ncbi:MAG: type IX secretion system PorP/SprF family membrane protein [Limisphaerales bacterium]|jgi:type IX secretion system PorP/SprF family membrane protein
MISRSMIKSGISALSLILCLFAVQDVSAQQDPLQIFYMEHKLLMNPAYAGSRDGLSITAQYRHQWAGMDDAPRTTSLSAHTPLGNGRNSVGIIINDDRLGVSNETGFQLNYAYRVPLGPGRFSAGINAGVARFSADLNQVFLFENDPLFGVQQTLWLPSAGAGIWYDTENWFVGISAPHLYRIFYDSEGFSRQSRYYYTTAGYVLSISENIRLRPSAIFRMADSNLPLQVEGDLSVELLSRIWIGGGYRTGAAFKGHMLATLSEGLSLGYNYGHDLNILNTVNKGSHSVMVRLEFDKLKADGKSILSPRKSPSRAF